MFGYIPALGKFEIPSKGILLRSHNLMPKSYTSQEHLEYPPSLEIHPQMTTTDQNKKKVTKRLKLFKRSNYPLKRSLNIRTLQSEDKENYENVKKDKKSTDNESTLTL